jgi:hypothetical protein
MLCTLGELSLSKEHPGVRLRKMHWRNQPLYKKNITKASGVIWKELRHVNVPRAIFSHLFAEVPAEKVSACKEWQVKFKNIRTYLHVQGY